MFRRRGTKQPAASIDAWAFYRDLGEADRSGLSTVEQEVAAVCDLRQEVNSGGFDVYFRYWGGNTAPIALAASPKVLGPSWAEVLDAAMSLFGSEYPMDSDDRFDIIDERQLGEQLRALDRRYFDLENSSEADRLVSAYLQPT